VLGTVALTWFVWYRTWFGARLSDEALLAAAAPAASPRDAQHAVSEIERRFREHAVGMDRWAKTLVDVSRRPEAPVRVLAAWGMGADPGRAEFAARLGEMLSDESVLVRRNAACALAASGDAAGRPVLRSMLSEFVVTSPVAGAPEGLPAVGATVRDEALVGRVRLDDGAAAEVRAPVAGRVRSVSGETRVTAGAPLVVLAPDDRHALNAARALAVVGAKEDLDLLLAAGAPQAEFGEDVKAAARRAAEAVRAREK
jgi:hypothetical protein